MSEGLFENVYNPDVLSCLANLSSDEVFTPPSIANEMLDMLPQEIFSNPDTRILDPACKSGVFLREAAKRFDKGLEKQIPDREQRFDHIFKKQLFGIAITELTSLISRRSVYCSAYPNSKYSVARFDDAHADGNIRFKRIEHLWKDEKCSWCGAAQAQYDRSEDNETHAYEFIHCDPKELYGMKFDVIISNPPYQLSDGGNGASAKPIYNFFVEQAKKLNPNHLCMIIPARWYAGGKGLDEFRANMLNDIHISEIHDFPNTDDCFPGVNIRGGVCYFLWSSNYNNHVNLPQIYSHDKDKVTISERPLISEKTDIFVRYGQSITILNKVVEMCGENVLSNIVSSRKPFGLSTDFIKDKNYHLNSSDLKAPVLCYGKNKMVGYVPRNQIEMHENWINTYKVYVPRANNIGTELNDDNLNSFIGNKNTICTESYIVIGADLEMTMQEARNLCNYLKTRFVRFMHSLAKVSQDATSKTYRFIPMQDFTKPWTDEELYAKYNLTQEEIDFIESMIKPMEIGGDDNG